MSELSLSFAAISEDLVWRVARYTSSSPMHFGEQDYYVDGGVFAQNPTDIGLIVIQEFYRNQLSIAVVVSLGSGRFPAPAKAETLGHMKFSFLHPIQFIRSMVAFAGAAVSCTVMHVSNYAVCTVTSLRTFSKLLATTSTLYVGSRL